MPHCESGGLDAFRGFGALAGVFFFADASSPANTLGGGSREEFAGWLPGKAGNFFSGRVFEL